MNSSKAVLAGIIATVVMSAVAYFLAPLMGLPRMDFGHMLGTGNPIMALPYVVGWLLHLLMGIVFAVIYAKIFIRLISGTPLLKGLVFGLVVFLVAQLAVMPMMGVGVFSGGHVPTILASLLGHLIFGAVLGLVYNRR